ncbi:hypothetical protein E3O06_16315 [Cryobacterium glaciale]|uniref:Transcriptional regulator n=1 Tax=Cryobacterium glaciale TaxID=1259145 RepID=A0A4R8UPA4_9MICO|nr:type IV toxin-antitoxin system AbiEi family antitoxin domain-containing protein [Cryobacterium glaciale]TFB68080.1 hypothetical protein E3O06_16315 [Cryobacterium glaciale]
MKLPSELDGSIYRRRDLARAGIGWRSVDALLDAGAIMRIAPGAYARTDLIDDDTAALASIVIRKPQATIALASALDRHDLTDAIPSRIDIALPRGSRSLKTPTSRIRWHSFDAATFEIGRETIELIDGIRIGLYSAERTIIDVFRTGHMTGPEHANEALKRWLRRPGSQPSELISMAKSFPKALPAIRSALEILL